VLTDARFPYSVSLFSFGGAMKTLLMSLDSTRFVGSTLALFLAMSLTGCDQVQDMVDGGADADAPAPAASAGTVAAPVQPTVANPVEPPAPADPAQILAAFRAIPPREVTEAALKAVADVPEAAVQILDLDMTGSEVSGGGLTLLAKFPNLKTVKLSRVQNLPGGFVGFSPQSTFSEIDLDNSTIDDAGLNSLAQVRTLKRVNLSGTRLTPAGLIPLGNLGELVDLDLSGTSTGDQITAVLATLPLVRLNCSKTAISDVGLPQLAKISTLEDLTLSFCRVTGTGFRVFKGAKLKKLNIGATAFGVEGLMVLRGMVTLEELTVYEARIIQHKNALVFGSLPNLKKLNIGKNAINDAGLGLWFKGCRSLEHLSIGANPNVTNAGLAGLISLKNLQFLDCGSTGVNAQRALALKQKIPELTIRIGTGEEI
jgi:hypothetical protein